MMPKDVSISGNAPDALSLPPGPAPAKSTQPGREFSSVMDQATARKAAHTRTTRSASRGRGGEAESTTGRDRMTRGEPSARPVSRSAKSPAKNVADDNRPAAKPVAAESKSAVKVVSEEETATAEESAGASSASPKGKASAAEAPANIVPFPGAMATSAVIIPFPLLEAQAPAPEGTSPVSAPGNAAGAGADAAQVSAPVNSVIVPLPDTRPATTGRAVSGGGRAEESSDGIDVEQLGLRPVTSREPLETSAADPARAKPASEGAAASGNLESNIVSVAFRAMSNRAERERKARASGEAQTQLPGEPAQRVESAASGTISEASAKIVLLRTDAVKSASGAASNIPGRVADREAEPAGTSVARQDVRMESTTTSGRETATAGQSEGALVRLPDLGSAPVPETERAQPAVPAHGLAQGGWETARLLNEVSRSDSTMTEVNPSDSTGTVERISNLIVREAALVKKHGSDSMAVVLRPDAETELFVHLSQSNGQIEATIRCERGDAHQLGALWSQLQESLAQQKIRLAPLQETSGGNPNFNQSSDGSTAGGGQNGARQEARPGKQSMDEWPAPAAPAAPAPHVRETGGSRRRRITTSRPGWETWA